MKKLGNNIDKNNNNMKKVNSCSEGWTKYIKIMEKVMEKIDKK